MSNDQPQTTKKRMPLMMEESGYIVGVIETPKDAEQTDWTLIAELLRALAAKIEECADAE
jgi:hypothetical protein